nr:CotS family spore coat protein [Paenibacillus beijingensis]
MDVTASPGIVLEQYVPPELEELARQVSELYEMRVNAMTLITSKPDKGGAIWKIETDRGPRSLKVLHRKPPRSLFSVGAQEYLVNQGAKVPGLIATKEGSLYVEAGGKLWIVTDWIEPLAPVSKIDLEGAAALCYGLGEFHRFSKGYIHPHSAQKSSRVYGWPKYYEKIIAKIGWFRDIAEAYREFPASSRLLGVVDEFERQARENYGRLLESGYSKIISIGEPYLGLAHQDYGWSNGQLGPGGIWVIDLDGVSYDLVIRDLRKLITSTMDDMGTWDIGWIRGMIDAYHQANPIDRETFEVLLIDMAFPNEFYKHVKEIVFDPETFISMELDMVLDRVLMAESTKMQVLAELAGDIMKYEPGQYDLEGVQVFDRLRAPDRTLQGSYLALERAAGDRSAFVIPSVGSAFSAYAAQNPPKHQPQAVPAVAQDGSGAAAVPLEAVPAAVTPPVLLPVAAGPRRSSLKRRKQKSKRSLLARRSLKSRRKKGTPGRKSKFKSIKKQLSPAKHKKINRRLSSVKSKQRTVKPLLSPANKANKRFKGLIKKPAVPRLQQRAINKGKSRKSSRRKAVM